MLRSIIEALTKRIEELESRTDYNIVALTSLMASVDMLQLEVNHLIARVEELYITCEKQNTPIKLKPSHVIGKLKIGKK